MHRHPLAIYLQHAEELSEIIKDSVRSSQKSDPLNETTQILIQRLKAMFTVLMPFVNVSAILTPYIDDHPVNVTVEWPTESF
ncbi:MAG: hypothetical protein Q4A55_01925 [Aerococcus sp.]|nr:hypothetical protein [Aerococcus sp.]